MANRIKARRDRMRSSGTSPYMRGFDERPDNETRAGARASLVGEYIKPDPSGCWLWTGTIVNGYGKHGDLIIHRYTYETLVRQLDNDEVLHHTCFVKHCCNPEHLEPMSQGEHLRLHNELRHKQLA